MELGNEEEQRNGWRLKRVEEFIEVLQGQCGPCWIKGGWSGNRHRSDDCDELSRLLGEEFREWKRKEIRWVAHSCCFSCGRPGDMCLEYSSQKRCGREDVILQLVLMAYMWRESEYVDVIEEFAGRKFENVRSFWRWLCQRRRVLGFNGTNCFGVFERIMEHHCEKVESEQERMDIYE